MTARVFSIPFVAALAATALPAAALDVPGPLVSPEWVNERLSDENLLVVDLRGTAAFAASTVPTAVSGPYPQLWRDATWRVLPVEQLAANAGALGIGPDHAVVLVPAGGDSTEFGGASSADWMLRYLGHENVAVLDGGYAAWRAAYGEGAAAAAGPATPTEFAPAVVHAIRVDTEAVLAALEDGTAILVDARPPSEFAGDTKSPLVAQAGRIPGAINLPHTAVYDAAAGRLQPADALRALLPAVLANPEAQIIVYCNTGHWSSIIWFALHEVLGYANARLYDGSMQAWTAEPGRPVVTGAP